MEMSRATDFVQSLVCIDYNQKIVSLFPMISNFSRSLSGFLEFLLTYVSISMINSSVTIVTGRLRSKDDPASGNQQIFDKPLLWMRYRDRSREDTIIDGTYLSS